MTDQLTAMEMSPLSTDQTPQTKSRSPPEMPSKLTEAQLRNLYPELLQQIKEALHGLLASQAPGLIEWLAMLEAFSTSRVRTRVSLQIQFSLVESLTLPRLPSRLETLRRSNWTAQETCSLTSRLILSEPSQSQEQLQPTKEQVLGPITSLNSAAMLSSLVQVLQEAESLGSRCRMIRISLPPNPAHGP